MVYLLALQSSSSSVERNAYPVPVTRRLSIESTNRPVRLRDQPKHSELLVLLEKGALASNSGTLDVMLSLLPHFLGAGAGPCKQVRL